MEKILVTVSTHSKVFLNYATPPPVSPISMANSPPATSSSALDLVFDPALFTVEEDEQDLATALVTFDPQPTVSTSNKKKMPWKKTRLTSLKKIEESNRELCLQD